MKQITKINGDSRFLNDLSQYIIESIEDNMYEVVENGQFVALIVETIDGDRRTWYNFSDAYPFKYSAIHLEGADAEADALECSRLMINKHEFIKLLDRYCDAKNDILSFTEVYYDRMVYDIDGWYEYVEEGYANESDYSRLKLQVKAAQELFRALSKLNYRFS